MINPFEIMKNLDQMKAAGEELKKKLPTIKESGSAMGGEVVAVVTGEMQLESLKINPDIINDCAKSGSSATLEVFITSAVNDALANMRRRLASETNSIASPFGVNLG